jgi:hypothetical protein
LSGCHGRQPDDGIIADGRDGFQRHVTRTLDRPFVVLFEQDGIDETPALLWPPEGSHPCSAAAGEKAASRTTTAQALA